MAALPPGPPPSFFRRLIYRPGRDPLVFFRSLAATYGDLVHVGLGGDHLYIVSDPQRIRDILVTDNARFMKGRGLERAKRLLGNGLLTSEGAAHRRHRRLLQPAFHRERIAAYGSVMVAYADRVRSAWTDGVTVDAAHEMARLTLAIVGRTLFDADVIDQAREVGDALSGVMNSFWLTMLPFADWIERLSGCRFRSCGAAAPRGRGSTRSSTG